MPRPTTVGGFERRGTHSVLNLLSIAQRREHAQEHFFRSEVEIDLRRCEPQGARVWGAFPTLVQGAGIAHLVCGVVEVKRISFIREDAAQPRIQDTQTP